MNAKTDHDPINPPNQENISSAPDSFISDFRQRLEAVDKMYKMEANLRLVEEQNKKYEMQIAKLRTAQEQNEMYEKQFETWQKRLIKMEDELKDERQQLHQAETELADEKLCRQKMERELTDEKLHRQKLESELTDEKQHRQKLEGELTDEKQNRQKLESELELMKAKKDNTVVAESRKLAEEFGTDDVDSKCIVPVLPSDAERTKELKELGTLKKRLLEQRETIKTLKQKNQSLDTHILVQQEVLWQYEKTLKPFNTLASNLRDLENIKEIAEADGEKFQELVSNMGSPTPSMCPSYSGKSVARSVSSHSVAAAVKGPSEKFKGLSLD